ncbi:hypothetical protein CIPAW_15G130600 [Carya illinoinensis]|nr:hypothetical protein CIPAW_15G130600 [Carya illinoinensis]KAG6627470.1 hypothetical protein CIPAW_15G130600 [Carya illinoinensis]KAG6627471.1 hypothetical protein CIPAW_15G130600 [Carya illinoinensis]
MKSVIECLASLRAQFMLNVVVDNFSLTSLITNCGSPRGDAFSSGHLCQLSGEERQKLVSNSDFQPGLSNPVMSEPSVALKNQAGQKYHKVFELKPGRYEDLSLSRSSEMMKTNCLDTEQTKMEERKKFDEEDFIIELMKETDQKNLELSALKQELEITKKTCELQCMQVEREAKNSKIKLEKRLKELECLSENSENKVKELELYSDSKYQMWNQKEQVYQRVVKFQPDLLQEMRLASTSIRQEILKAQNSYSEEFNCLGVKLKVLADAAENYYTVLAENRKMFNEIQELKALRLYILPHQFINFCKREIIESVGENGELVIANPKLGKENHPLFKFDLIFGPTATQAKVFSDVQPLIRSAIDGYDVLTGPNVATKENWGVNYRALNYLFDISRSRRSSITYEMGVQMVEIYNEQVHDLLSSVELQILSYVFPSPLLHVYLSLHLLPPSTQQIICFLDLGTLGILTYLQPNGLAEPDANMQPVKSASGVMELMDTGLRNTAVGSTALNERSSRSHSVVTIHVGGRDLKTGAAFHGNLHLVDLAGSERVDCSEVTGDRLREAQHINKSLSALGDVIFALAQKSPHVPYRNSKLTQLLQSSLGGQAKTLMFVQLNPDKNSYSEIELGAAWSSRELKDVRELMEQVASLKETIAKKDGEIERLQLLKDLKNVHPGSNGEKRGTPQQSQKPTGGKGLVTEKSASDHDNSSELKHSEADSQQSVDDLKCQNELLRQSKTTRALSDISDGGLSMETDTDGSAENAEGRKSSDHLEK